MRNLASLEIYQSVWRGHFFLTPATAADIFETKNTGILHKAFELRARRSIVCNLQNPFDGAVSLYPLRGTFGHFKMRNQTGVDIRRVANINLVVAQLQYVCEEAIAVGVVGRPAQFRVFVRYVNVHKR